jgi:ubiquinone/menaquinone biosynthesis C-methylase UbiE
MKRLLKAMMTRLANALGVTELNRKQDLLLADIAKIRRLVTEVQYQTAESPDGLPIPPAEYHFLVSSNRDLDLADFFSVGYACANGVNKTMERVGVRLEDLGAILDFGCGCGRVIRHFQHLQGPRLYGCDYNPALVEWCQKHLQFAEFTVNQLRPPLPYSDEQFDLIYCYSVFTHLSDEDQRLWIDELFRVLKPGGYLMVTMHGDSHAQAFLSPDDLRRFQSGDMVVVRGKVSGENTCATYHPQGYVDKMVANKFQVVHCNPGKIFDLKLRKVAQDQYVFQKTCVPAVSRTRIESAV